MKKYAICCNYNIDQSEKLTESLIKELTLYNVDYKVIDVNSPEAGYDFVFVVGGDGTILKTARFYSKYKTPIFGINLGHLGFLSQASNTNLKKAVQEIIEGNYSIEKRMMLQSDRYLALNDFVVKGETTSRAINFSLEITNKFVCEYFADGIIVSTPTGSTAYSMAAGGPVLVPDIEAITITPICPHTFSARPIVVSSNSKIKIIANPSYKYKISADGQEVFTLNKEFIINKSEMYANLALLKDNDFFSILKSKLNWGFSPYKNK